MARYKYIIVQTPHSIVRHNIAKHTFTIIVYFGKCGAIEVGSDIKGFIEWLRAVLSFSLSPSDYSSFSLVDFHSLLYSNTMKFSPLFLVPLLTATYVSAHGVLRRISIQGKVYEGNVPGTPSVIRLVSKQDPNKGANNPALSCGPDSGPAALVADANPGDNITFDWRTASDGTVC